MTPWLDQLAGVVRGIEPQAEIVESIRNGVHGDRDLNSGNRADHAATTARFDQAARRAPAGSRQRVYRQMPALDSGMFDALQRADTAAVFEQPSAPPRCADSSRPTTRTRRASTPTSSRCG